ncbi:MAG: ABC transporter substrate-binding protein [Thermodesulfobacteriota bacterium]
MRGGFADRLATALACLLLAWSLLPAPALAAQSFVDDSGQTIAFERPFARIVSLYPAHAEVLIALGARDALIAAGPSPVEGMDAAPLISYRDDPERILALAPDLVLVRPMIHDGYPHLIARLKQFGIAVASLQPGGAEELYEYWRRLGALCGRPERAEALVADFAAELARLRGRAAAIPDQQRPRVFFESIHRQFKTFSPDSLAIFALAAAGGVNAAADARPVRDSAIAEYGHERILALAEGLDVYLAQVGTMNRVTAAEIAATPGFGALKAVRQGRVHLVDEALVSRPTPRLIEGARRIQALILPELAPEAGR